MARNIQSVALRNFTGGLNLRADQFQLDASETPDALNVDMDPRGGVRLRKGVEVHTVTNTGGFPVHSLGQFRDETVGFQLLAGYDKTIKYFGGSSGTVVSNQTVDTPFSNATFKSATYIQNGVDKPIRWTGVTATRLNQAWSEDIGAPTTGNMPVGRSVVSHNGHVFVANTLELAVRYPNRIRFSHINQPESFRSMDYIDIDPGVDGDGIVAIVPFQDHLVVFKERSSYVLYGFDADSFQVQNMSREVGLVGPNAVTVTPQGVYFFAHESGMMAWQGKGLSWKFDKIIPAMDGNDIRRDRLDTVCMGWVENRVWLSVPWETTDRRVFVYDPSLSKEGSWTAYELMVGPVMGIIEAGAVAADMGGSVLRLEVDDQPYDSFTVPATQTHIGSHYVTPWIDAGEVAIRKRWRRPWFVFLGETNDQIEIGVYTDYNGASRRKTFFESVAAQGEASYWDDPTIKWDDPGLVWGGDGNLHQIERGSTLGLAHSVQLRFRGPESNASWGLDNITFTFIPRKLR